MLQIPTCKHKDGYPQLTAQQTAKQYSPQQNSTVHSKTVQPCHNIPFFNTLTYSFYIDHLLDCTYFHSIVTLVRQPKALIPYSVDYQAYIKQYDI